VTVRAWLDARDPVPPAALQRRMSEQVAGAAPEAEPAAACLAAAEEALARLVRDGDDSRAAALDLLAIDALVTYAFEAAATAPSRIDGLAADAMARLSRVATR